jgi:NAD(P)H-nitrite reductase large subunit
MRCVEVVGYHTEKPANYSEQEWNIYVEFNDGQIIGCDFVIEALGVVPNSRMWKECCSEVGY